MSIRTFEKNDFRTVDLVPIWGLYLVKYEAYLFYFSSFFLYFVFCDTSRSSSLPFFGIPKSHFSWQEGWKLVKIKVWREKSVFKKTLFRHIHRCTGWGIRGIKQCPPRKVFKNLVNSNVKSPKRGYSPQNVLQHHGPPPTFFWKNIPYPHLWIFNPCASMVIFSACH